ncbi:hypothetical protein V6N13_002749 [Hibiscus sabdariffa]
MHSFFVAEKRTYDRFKLHLPKQFCLLPKLPFLEDFPEYPITEQVMEYLGSYARRLDDTSRSCRRYSMNCFFVGYSGKSSRKGSSGN